MHFMVVKKSRIRSGFVIYSYFKDSTYTAVKSSKLDNRELGCYLSMEGI